MPHSSQLPDVDFRDIRTLGGSKHYAFEEFCCHIARRDKSVPPGSTWVRYEGVGGDGGVECIWQRPDGQEWGWQAKYLFRLDKRQLDKSVRTALEIHPNLTRYIICLPCNLTGRTGRKGKSQAERFTEYESEWDLLAKSRGKNVRFEHLCKSDLLTALLDFDSHQGRLRFWFSEEFLGDEWFVKHREEIVTLSHPRYTPDLRVNVPVATAFEAFGRTPSWRQSVLALSRDVRKSSEGWGQHSSGSGSGITPEFPAAAKEPAESLRRRLAEIEDILTVFAREGNPGIPGSFRKVVANGIRLASQCLLIARDDLEAKHGKGAADSIAFRHFAHEVEAEFPEIHVDTARDLVAALTKLSEWLNGPEADLPESPTMILVGPAGIGKTHALCDASVERHKNGFRSVVFFGEGFNHVAGEPWERMRSQLGFGSNISRDEFFGMLDAAGECSRQPLVIFIDALNETVPRRFWYDSLAGLAQQMKRYDWLKLCVSCRTTYLEDVIPPGFDWPRIEHTGFAGVEFNACAEFFDHYKLELPSMALLQPEFSNPLFLRLVCESLKDANVTRLPQDGVGISHIVRFVLDSKNKKLARELDYDPREKFVQRAIEGIVSEMQKRNARWLPWRDAKGFVDAIRPSQQKSTSLFDHLLGEGLIREDRKTPTDAGSEPIDAVFIAFERMADHLLAEKYLADVSDGSLPDAFTNSGILHFAVRGEIAARENRGLLEALAVQVPERFGMELTEVAGGQVPASILKFAVIDSLVWRRADAFTSRTERIVRDALDDSGLFAGTMEALLGLSTRADNPLNANWFHDLLSSIKMPDRDADFCPFFHRTYGERQGLDRLIRWALDGDLRAVSNEVAELWATQLCWFCLAADRRVRDHATKAIVRVMDRHQSKWPGIIERFSTVDDEYVLERCLAAAYGSLIRTNQAEAIRETAKKTFELFFDGGLLPQNAMVRDYARLILELAADRNQLPEGINPEDYRPPYESEWPLELPTQKVLDLYEDASRDYPRLYQSLLGSLSDFLRYVIVGTVHGYENQVSEGQCAGWIFKHVLDMGYTPERFAAFDREMIREYGPGRERPVWAERIGKKYQWIALYRLMARLADNLEPERKPWELPAPSIPELQASGERNIDPTILVKKDLDQHCPCWWNQLRYDFHSAERLNDADWLDLSDFPDTAPALQVTQPVTNCSWLLLHTFLEWTDLPEEESVFALHRRLTMQIRSYLVRRTDRNKCWNWLGRRNLWNHLTPKSNGLRGFVGEYPWGLPYRLLFEESFKEEAYREVPCVMLETTNSISCNYELDAYQERYINLLVPHEVFFKLDHLSWDTRAGWVSASGQQCFLHSSILVPGPRAFLVEKEYLLEFLQKNELVLVWAVLGDKHRSGSGRPSEEIGWTYYCRIHMLADDRYSNSHGKTFREIPQQANQ